MKKILIKFLRKPRIYSKNLEYVERSWFVWGDVHLSQGSDEVSFYLSILGFINGFLRKIGLVLVVNEQPPVSVWLTKKWW